MNLSDTNSFVSFKGNTNTTEYTAANRLISMNSWIHYVTDIIYDSLLDYQHHDLNLASEPIVSKNTVADQEYVALGVSDKILKINRVEVSYDGTNYYKAEPISKAQITTSIVSQTPINNHFSTTTPYYEHKGQLIYLYPVPTSSVTNGLKLWIDKEAPDFSSSDVSTGTAEFGFAEPFHKMIPLGMLFDWFTAKGLGDKAQSTKAELDGLEQRLRRYYGRIDNDSPMRISPAYQDYE